MIVGALNVKYSPNLGDGLLAECLEAELAANGPDIRTVAIDLAGRTAYGDGMRHRRAVLSLLEAAPGGLRQVGVGMALGLTVQRKLRPRWRELLRGVDALVLGGGNLLADADLNFPMKIEGALSEAAAAGIPLGIYGIGVSDNWSPKGQALFERAMTMARPIHVAVRDPLSKAIWDRRLGPVGVPWAQVCPDPAVLAAIHFPAAQKAPSSPRVGLGITNPIALRYHAADVTVRDEEMAAWMGELVQAMAAKGWNVVLFTNGSPEDRDYLAKIAPRLQAVAGNASVAPGFSQPGELAAFISGLDLVMAHRMHACIAAYAYAKPHIGFAWDTKLQSFFDSVGRGEFVVEAGRTATGDIMRLAERALREGVDDAIHAACVRDTRRGIARLVDALRTSSRQPVLAVAAR